MPKAKHHDKPFDPGTVVKLTLFERYLESFLPVFIHHPGIQKINIFDFFCGPGADIEGRRGSPIRAVDAISKHAHSYKQSNQKISAFFSDIDSKKIEKLRQTLDEKGYEKDYLEITLKKIAFEEAFDSYYDIMTKPKTANFLFIDPCGLAVKPDLFQTIISLKLTDFLLFTPSSNIVRFYGDRSFQLYYPGLEYHNDIDGDDRHKYICNYYKNRLLPNKLKYYLAPFSIKKQIGSTVHGLIFGSGSIRGLDKFIAECWKVDKDGGEMGIGLESDLPPVSRQCLLDPEFGKSQKLRSYEKHLERKILSKQFTNNRQVYDDALLKGCLPRHAKDVLKRMKKEGKIQTVPNISYESIYKKKNIQQFEIV